ncbi:hypothetical protein KQI65_05510 [bacterium]|nr:hypothetical protein [bacterium]
MLRLAVLGKTGLKLNVMDLASMPLPMKQFSASMDDEGEQGGGGSKDNPFDDVGSAESADASPEDNIDFSSIREFIATHFVPRATFSLGFEVPNVRTLLLPVDKKDTPSKIRSKVIEEVQKSLNVELSKRALDYTRAGDKQVLAIARAEDHPVVEICSSPQGSERRPTRIDNVTSNEIALINMVRVHFRAEADQLVHVIHVDDDVTHFFVLRGHDIEYIGPAIQQGAHDAHLVSTLYNRIELTAENAGYLNPDKVVLSGKAEEIGLKEEILENNPEVVFHSLKQLRVGHSDDNDILRDMNNYLIPISLAWQQLQPKNTHFYRLDVLPEKIRDSQKRFKLAWHGVLLFVLLFVAVTILTVIGLRRQAEISQLDSALEFDRQQMQEQKIIVEQIGELEQRSTSIRNATTTLDTLLMNAELWSETLDTLAVGAAALQDIWVSEMKYDKDGALIVTGYTVRRASIPDFTKKIGKTKLQEITVQEIGDHKVYRYEITLKPDSLYPYSNSRAARWHDSVRTALGDVVTAQPAGEAAPSPGVQRSAPAGEQPPEGTPPIPSEDEMNAATPPEEQ